MQQISFALLAIALSGCATLAAGVRQEISVTSQPAGADVRLVCDGVRRDAGVTPTKLHMARAHHHCLVLIDKEGYAAQSLALRRGVNHAVFLNLSVGWAQSSWYDLQKWWRECGRIGGCGGERDEHSLALLLEWSSVPALVDIATGAVYEHGPAEINVTLSARSATP